MADTLTPNYSFVKPEIGGSDDTWGNKTNDNWDKVDGLLRGGSDRFIIKNGVHTMEFRVIASGDMEVYGDGVKIAVLTVAGNLQIKGDIEGFAF